MTAHRRPLDALLGFEVGPHYRRFRQRDDVFNRARWDPTLRSPRTDALFASFEHPAPRTRPADGFAQRDYAVRNAGWHVADVLATASGEDGRQEGFTDTFTLPPKAPRAVPFADPGEARRHVARVARMLGADLFGVCAFDERWVYAAKYRRSDGVELPVDLPDGLTRVIVVAVAMDEELIATTPLVTSGAATGLGYSRDAALLVSLARYVRELGYEAHASLNDTAVSVPLGVAAGLGEYARNGLLVTPEFGARVRLGKVFTDLPLAPDAPRHFGVRAFCAECRRCAEACPVKAVPDGPPAYGAPTRSGSGGVCKWTIDAERCFRFWADLNTDCSICIRVCPFNRTFDTLRARLWRSCAGTRLRGLARWLHRRSGRGRRRFARTWWGDPSTPPSVADEA